MLCACCIAAVYSASSDSFLRGTDSEWEDFKAKHKKVYEIGEEAYRKEIWRANLEVSGCHDKFFGAIGEKFSLQVLSISEASDAFTTWSFGFSTALLLHNRFNKFLLIFVVPMSFSQVCVNVITSLLTSRNSCVVYFFGKAFVFN